MNTIPGVINTRIHITFTPTVNYEFPSGDERPLIASSISVSEMQKDDDGCIEKWSLTTRDRPACVARTTSSETTSCSEVPSNSMKGKRPHPCNWDAISGMSDGIDVDGQRPALASWKAAQKLARASSEDVSRADAATHLSKPAEPSQTHVETNWGEAKVTTKGETRKVNPKKNENPVRVIVDNVVARRASRHRRRPTPRAMEPVKQIDPTAFKRLGRKGKRTRNKHWRSSSDDESSDSSGSSNDSSSSDTSSSSKSARADETSTSDSDNGDSPSGSESDPSGDSSSTSSDEGPNSSSASTSRTSGCHSQRSRSPRRRGHKSKRSTRKSDRKKRKAHRRMTLEPIPPTKYDGSADFKAFHLFTIEGTAYVKDGRVPSKKRAFILARFLTGKAEGFYIHEVLRDPYKWRLREFFRELYKYCFPVNFRIEQRRKLQSCYQTDRTVRDYIYELDALWNMIGETDERTKVHKLWSGLRKEIQHDLRREKLDPGISSLREVIASALQTTTSRRYRW